MCTRFDSKVKLAYEYSETRDNTSKDSLFFTTNPAAGLVYYCYT